MSGDAPVRFCERLGVGFPQATHPVIIFEQERDARRVLDVLPKRLAKYGLRLHPEKTRLVDFRCPVKSAGASCGSENARPRPGSFDLLGFTHCWAASRKGVWVVRQKTAKDRFQRALKRVADWCRRHRHEPVREQWTALKRKLLGHFGYFGITGNSRALHTFYYRVICVWRKWLSRRSQRAYLPWASMTRLLEHYPLPQPRIRAAPVA
jgi:RNA-directed DNA polymerase